MHLSQLDKAIQKQEENIKNSKPLIVTDVNYHAKFIGEKNLPSYHKKKVTVLRSIKKMNSKK